MDSRVPKDIADFMAGGLVDKWVGENKNQTRFYPKSLLEWHCADVNPSVWMPVKSHTADKSIDSGPIDFSVPALMLR